MTSLVMDWCRLCAREDLDATQPKSPDCYQRITKYLSIQVQEENNLPNSICKACCEILADFDNYAQQCQKVQCMFQSLLIDPGIDHGNPEAIRAYKNDFFRHASTLPPVYKIKACDAFNRMENHPVRIENGSENNALIKKIAGNIWNEPEQLPKEEYDDKEDVYCNSYSSEDDYLPLSSITDKDSSSKNERRKVSKKISKNSPKPKRKRKEKSKEKMSVLEKLINESINVKEESKSDDENMKDSIDESPEIKEPKKPRMKPFYDNFFSYQCYICEKDLKNWNALCLHFRDSHDSRAKVKCCCGKLLASRVSIARHYASHGKTESFDCTKCDKRFPRQSELESHMITHLPKEEYPFVCCKCARRFTSQQLLKLHEKKHIPVEERLIHPCEVCKSKFASKSSLLAHMRAVHQRLKPFICDQCGRAFTTKGILEEHQVRHSDARPHVCNVCHKSFKTKQRLTIHLDTHNDTVYKCPHCPVFLNSRRTLRMHLFVHDSVARYQCTFCDKAFKRAKDLKNHTNLHTGRRPYSCPWCSRTFANGSNCRAHKRRMHPHELRISDAKVAMLNKVLVPPDAKPNVEKTDAENVEPKVIYPTIKRKTTSTSSVKMPNFIFSPDVSEKDSNTVNHNSKDIAVTICIPNPKMELTTPTKQEKSSPTHIYESSLSPLNLNTSGVTIKCDEARSENPALIVSPIVQNDCNLAGLISNNQNNTNSYVGDQNSAVQVKNQQLSYSIGKDGQIYSKTSSLYANFEGEVPHAYILPDITVPSPFNSNNPFSGNN